MPGVSPTGRLHCRHSYLSQGEVHFHQESRLQWKWTSPDHLRGPLQSWTQLWVSCYDILLCSQSIMVIVVTGFSAVWYLKEDYYDLGLRQETPLGHSHTDTDTKTHNCYKKDHRKYWSFTEFDQCISLLAVFHIGKIHLPAFEAFLLLTTFVPTLELTWKTREHTYYTDPNTVKWRFNHLSNTDG